MRRCSDGLPLSPCPSQTYVGASVVVLERYGEHQPDQGPPGRQFFGNGASAAAAESGGRTNPRTAPIVSRKLAGGDDRRARFKNAAHCADFSWANSSVNPSGRGSIAVERCSKVALMASSSTAPSNG